MAFIVFVLCVASGFLMWRKDYARRMKVLREKHMPEARIEYEPGGGSNWHCYHPSFRFGQTSCSTYVGAKYVINRQARSLEKAERLRSKPLGF